MQFNLYTMVVSRIVLLLKLDHTAVSFTLFILSSLMSLGILIVGMPSTIPSLAVFSNPVIWVVLFSIYGSVKVIQCLGRTHPILRILFSISGLWLWTYTALSFLTIDTARVTPTDFLVFLPILCELGYLSSLIYMVKLAGKGRRPYDI